ncbi:MAG: hypothetical protein RL756_683 [Pseudomonadota bacterium]|jgi:hypothetical protein
MGSADLRHCIEARERFVDRRFQELRGALLYYPSTRVAAIWSAQLRPTVGEELVAWICETADQPEAAIAMAITNPWSRRETLERFCEARAQAEADALPSDYFNEVA